MPLTRMVIELHEKGIYVYYMNNIFSFKKLYSASKNVTFKTDELLEYMKYLSLDEFVTLIINRLT